MALHKSTSLSFITQFNSPHKTKLHSNYMYTSMDCNVRPGTSHITAGHTVNQSQNRRNQSCIGLQQTPELGLHLIDKCDITE